MQLTWYGAASLVLQEGETVIAFDPFSGMRAHIIPRHPVPLPYTEEFRRAQSVFVTHGHFDHIYHIPRLYQDSNVKIYCTKTPLHTLRKRGVAEDKLCEISPGWQGDVGPFHITAYQSRHCRFDRPLVSQKLHSPRMWKNLPHLLYLAGLDACYPEHGEIVLYEVECGKKRIQIMGSMNLDGNTEYPTGADLLVLPLQGRSDEDEYALEFVERLKPRRVVLDHYDDAFYPLSDDIDTSGFERNVRECYGISCKPLKKGETISE